MESYETLEFKKRLERTETALNQKGCKNGMWVMARRGEEYGPAVTGCPNERRNGSAYCQECSDKNNK